MPLRVFLCLHYGIKIDIIINRQMEYLLYFMTWTFMIYWLHRTYHSIPFCMKFHQDHHTQIIEGTGSNKWDWRHVFIWIDTWNSTVDQWIMEVIPTIIFSWITGQWWMCVFYWIWTAFMQERVEHNPKFNLMPFITSGKWHLEHHHDSTKNFGVFFPIWDWLFGTYRDYKKEVN